MQVRRLCDAFRIEYNIYMTRVEWLESEGCIKVYIRNTSMLF